VHSSNEETDMHTHSKPFVPDFLNIKHEYLFKIIGRDGKYSLEMKCLFLVLILYVPGLVTTFFSGTLDKYVLDGWQRFVSTIIIGIVLWLLIRFLKRIGLKLQHVSEVISPPRKLKPTEKGYDKWKHWESKVEDYKEWTHSPARAPHVWYYSEAILAAIIGFIFSNLILKPDAGWAGNYLPNILFFHAWFTFLGFLVGAFLYYVWSGFWAIRKYCKDVISSEEILPLDPDRTGWLRELGRLSLDLDLVVALPSIAFPLYLSSVKIPAESWIGIALLYALVLVFVFFVSISPAHDDMVAAKTDYLLKVHSEYKDIHEGILQKLESDELINPEEYKELSGLYELYDRVERMSVWPLDFQTTLRFSITSLLPLVTVGITISI
jgi:hypothetical protein